MVPHLLPSCLAGEEGSAAECWGFCQVCKLRDQCTSQVGDKVSPSVTEKGPQRSFAAFALAGLSFSSREEVKQNTTASS